jgi:hypothetical protein
VLINPSAHSFAGREWAFIFLIVPMAAGRCSSDIQNKKNQ